MLIAENQELIEALAHKCQEAELAVAVADGVSSVGSSFDSPVVMSFDVSVHCVIVDVEHEGVQRELIQFFTQSGRFLAERLCLV